MSSRCCALALLGAVVLVLAVSAGDWPAWRGPGRDGVSDETGLLQKWPEDGPKLLWKMKGLGSGYSTPSIAGGKIYVMGTKTDVGTKGGGKGGGFGGFGKGGPSVPEYLFCLDAEKEGKVLWSTEIGKTAGAFPGARCTPTVADGRVFVLSSNGLLACVSADKGEIVWKKNLEDAYGGKKGMFGYSESPLVDGDVVVCTPGGSKATLVALKAKTGDEVWKSSVTGLKMKEGKGGFGKGGGKGGGGFGGFGGKAEYNTAAYSSPIKADVKGGKQYLQFLSGGVVGVSAKDGKLLWHYDEPSCGMANASTPIYRDGAVFAASGYNNGGGKAVITEDNGKYKAEQKFFVKSFQNMHGNMVLVKDHVYGTNDQVLMCVSFKDGEIAWQTRGVGKGSVTYADGHVYHRSENGTVALVEANPAKYVEKGRLRQAERSDQKAWATPVISGGKMYLRDWSGLLCYDVKGK
jgi:outer membrane protein assembly factor BamB